MGRPSRKLLSLRAKLEKISKRAKNPKPQPMSSNLEPPLSNFEKQLQVALDIAKESGAYIKSNFYSPRTNVESKDQSGLDLVTACDKYVEDLIFKTLGKEFPDDLLIGEESTHLITEESLDKFKTGYTWIVDPIDGTTNFVHGLPFVCVSIGLCYRGTPVVGVVYNPIMDELYYACQGQGAFMNDQKLPLFSSMHSSTCNSMVIATEFGADRTVKAMESKFKSISNVVNAPCRGIRCMGSAALACCYVARGTFDAFWESGIHIWDVAAAAVILSESGGILSNWDTPTDNLDLFCRKFVAVSSSKGLVGSQQKFQLLKQYLEPIEMTPDFGFVQ